MRALFLAVLMVVPMAAHAHPPRAGRSDLIHACVSPSGGVRLVGKGNLPANACIQGETAQHWVRETVDGPANYATTVPWSPEGQISPYSGDGRNVGFLCTGLPGETLMEDVALSRDLTTNGNPVVMAFTVEHRHLSDDTIRLFIHVDGRSLHGGFTDPWLTPDRPTVYHKLIPVPAGAHRFSVYVGCEDRFALGFRYMDVYELR